MYLFIKKIFLFFGIEISKTENVFKIKRTLGKYVPIDSEIDLIRIGNDGDGGYLVPNDLNGIEALFSPGVGQNSSFEKYFADQGVKCYLLDGSVEGPPHFHENFYFEKKFLGNRSDFESEVTLTDWVNSKFPRPSNNLILQIDIEGAEFESILATDSSILNLFRIIVIEIHDVHSIISRAGLRLISSLTEKLQQTHVVVHTHVNNNSKPITYEGIEIPDLLEVTLIRQDRISKLTDFRLGLHPMDRPNSSKRDFQLNWDKIIEKT